MDEQPPEGPPAPERWDVWNRRYPPGVRCDPCSARSLVPVYHPLERPCTTVDLRARATLAAQAAGRWDPVLWSRALAGLT